MHEHSVQLLKQLERVCDDTRRIARGQRRWLGIGFAPSTLYGALPELIRRLRSDGGIELVLAVAGPFGHLADYHQVPCGG